MSGASRLLWFRPAYRLGARTAIIMPQQAARFGTGSKGRYQPNSQESPTESFLAHIRQTRSNFASSISKSIGPLPQDPLSTASGRSQAIYFAVDCVYALDNFLHFLVSKVWAGSRRQDGISSCPGCSAGSSLRARLRAYYSQHPYEVVYHSLGFFIMAWVAWEQSMKLPMHQLQAVMQSTVLSASQLSQGKLWTLLTGPLIQPDSLVALLHGTLAALYGTRVVTYVGPWYALRLAAAGTTASTALFLIMAGLPKLIQVVNASDDAEQSPPPSSPAAPPQTGGFAPSTESSLTTAQRALNILKYGTHEDPHAHAQRPAQQASFEDGLFLFPHVGPAGGVAALAAFAVAAKPSATWSLWGKVSVPVPLPAIVACAAVAGAALASAPAERVSDMAHIVGGGAAGAAWLWGLRRGHVSYTRFWPKH